MYSMLLVFVDCPFLIAPSIFSNVYLLFNLTVHSTSSMKKQIAGTVVY